MSTHSPVDQTPHHSLKEKTMPRRSRTSSRAVAHALEQQRSTQPRPVVGLAIDMRLATEDLAKLSSDQVRAVFVGVGQLAALGVGR